MSDADRAALFRKRQLAERNAENKKAAMSVRTPGEGPASDADKKKKRQKNYFTEPFKQLFDKLG
jgi:hypothetical protein